MTTTLSPLRRTADDFDPELATAFTAALGGNKLAANTLARNPAMCNALALRGHQNEEKRLLDLLKKLRTDLKGRQSSHRAMMDIPDAKERETKTAQYRAAVADVEADIEAAETDLSAVRRRIKRLTEEETP